MISQFYNVNYESELGKGATGQVFGGSRKADGTVAAIKIIYRRKLNPSNATVIANEANALKKLEHVNITKLYDMYEDRVAYYMCMEMIRGGELFDRIIKKERYSEVEARSICYEILIGIKHCHDRNIVHRDLKPDNLMMASPDDDSAIKIVDFGFAVESHGMDLSGTYGTPNYMAPEIWNQEPHGKPVDMFSFGVIVYILLCGYPPFSSDKTARLKRLICTCTFAFHEEYWAQVSAEAKDFISKLIVVDMNARLTVDQALQHPWVSMYCICAVRLCAVRRGCQVSNCAMHRCYCNVDYSYNFSVHFSWR